MEITLRFDVETNKYILKIDNKTISLSIQELQELEQKIKDIIKQTPTLFQTKDK